jgi:hypothetical protein
MSFLDNMVSWFEIFKIKSFFPVVKTSTKAICNSVSPHFDARTLPMVKATDSKAHRAHDVVSMLKFGRKKITTSQPNINVGPALSLFYKRWFNSSPQTSTTTFIHG